VIELHPLWFLAKVRWRSHSCALYDVRPADAGSPPVTKPRMPRPRSETRLYPRKLKSPWTRSSESYLLQVEHFTIGSKRRPVSRCAWMTSVLSDGTPGRAAGKRNADHKTSSEEDNSLCVNLHRLCRQIFTNCGRSTSRIKRAETYFTDCRFSRLFPLPSPALLVKALTIVT
jgi:hypothetical protein